jgi:acetoin utilization protein AcuC
MKISSIATILRLPHSEQRNLFLQLIPREVIDKFQLNSNMIDDEGRDLICLSGEADTQSLEVSIFHEYGFEDPLIYCHITDTLNNQIHVLLYIMNDPSSPRFDVDIMPDGTRTIFGAEVRNLEAEQAAMEFGLMPGQIRKGLTLLGEAVEAFEGFVDSLGHNIYFVEPLYYHNAITFEKYGFNYQAGKRRMELIHTGFSSDKYLSSLLENKPFRKSEAKNSLFFRSWAIHDGILGEPYTYVTMYKMIGKKFNINTAPGLSW